jgi:4-hydroxy-2-oxoheptanedioate aldolase
MGTTLRARLQAGETAIATFIQTPSPVVCEFTGRLGFDALCVEAEHSAMDRAEVQSLVAAIELTPAEALVRVQANEQAAIAAALDAGAAGVIVPRVSSGEDAAAAVSAARFPPRGERGIGPCRAAGYGAGAAAYVDAAADGTLLAVQVETRRAIDRLDELLAVDGVDLVFVGPNDLALSLGLDQGAADPRLVDVITDVLTRARAAGRTTGIFAGSAAEARRWIDVGVGLVVLASDLLFLAQGAEAATGELRSRAGGTGR